MCAGKSFFESLYDYEPGGYVELRSIPSRKQSFHKATDAWKYISEHSGNIYFGVGLRASERGGDANISNIPAVWAEFDFKDFGGSRKVAELKIKQIELKPSIINHSGNGYHCYWKLDGGLDIIPRNVEYVKKIIYGFASSVGGDTKSTNLERILRVPGTKNLKDERRPKDVTCIYSHPRAYNISEFEEYMMDTPVKIGAESISVGSFGSDPPPRLYKDLAVNKWLQIVWRGERTSGDTSRSGNDFALAIRLFKLGYTPEEVCACLMAYEHGKAPIEQRRYIDFTVGRAKAYAEKTGQERR